MNIDDMTDEEIEAYLASADGVANRSYGITLVILSIIGAFGSLQLILAEAELKANPGQALKCDINELFGCSTFLTSWQGHLLGISNAWLGLAFFLGLAAVGVYLSLGKKLPRIMWHMLGLAAIMSILALAFFMTQSFGSRTLCPWCLLVWVAIVPLIVSTIGAYHEAVGLGPVGRFVSRYMWLVTLAFYAAIIIAVWIYFSAELGRIFGS